MRSIIYNINTVGAIYWMNDRYAFTPFDNDSMYFANTHAVRHLTQRPCNQNDVMSSFWDTLRTIRDTVTMIDRWAVRLDYNKISKDEKDGMIAEMCLQSNILEAMCAGLHNSVRVYEDA